MILRKELQAYLDSFLLVDSIADYCPNGLQIEGKEMIQHICFAVTADKSTIEAAIAQKADALIVHHGLLWQKEKEILIGTKKEKFKLILENDLSLFGYHLPLDKHEEVGNNWKAAKDLNMKNLVPFGKYGDNKPIYIGVRGHIDPMSRRDFTSHIETYYKHTATAVLGGPEIIKTVGIVSGGAYKCVLEAAQDQLDAFITGNFDEPAWYTSLEEKVNFFALGHHHTERVGPMALCDHIRKTLNVRCSFINTENPF